MANVTLTAALRSNLLSLQGTQSLLNQTQLRLATGKKVNTALDNPGAFFAAQTLSNRASDLGDLMDGIGQAVQTLKAADQGLTSLTGLLKQAQSIAQQARDGATGGATVVGTVNLTAAQAADLTTGGFTAAGDKFSIQLGTGPATTFTIAAGESLQTLANQINGINGMQATVESGTVAGTYRLRLQSTNGLGITTANVTNTPGTAILGAVGATAATTGAPSNQTSLESQYNNVLAQIDNLVKDSSYKGTNLMYNSGSLTVKFNETNTSTLTISGVNFTYAGLSINQASAGNSFSSIANIDTHLTNLKAALDTVRTQASAFGSNLSIIQGREDFTGNMINVLKEGSDKLTIADKNEEGANLLALQTSQQLGITSLSMASQANQAVMRLFG